MILQTTVSVAVSDGRVRLELNDGTDCQQHILHPLWLRERSTEAGHVDPGTRQRLFEPDVLSGVTVVDAAVERDDLVVRYSDREQSRHQLPGLLAELRPAETGSSRSRCGLPEPTPWDRPVKPPTLSWLEVDDERSLLEVIDSFHRLGWFLISDAPAIPGALRFIADRFGRISATTFGELFDVESKPNAEDLAYTPVALSAHTDQPYRSPTPGLQFLHTIVNDAPGGESTVVDGLAAVQALRVVDPPGYRALTEVLVEFRYEPGSIVHRAPIVECHPDGSVRQIRFSPRLDFAPAVDVDLLDDFYRARDWLARWLNHPAHQLVFKMEAGQVLVVDNHRVMHGRMPFDSTGGHRHLQGCYVDHDGPATLWRMLHGPMVQNDNTGAGR